MAATHYNPIFMMRTPPSQYNGLTLGVCVGGSGESGDLKPKTRLSQPQNDRWKNTQARRQATLAGESTDNSPTPVVPLSSTLQVPY